MAGVNFTSNISFGFSLAHSAGNTAEARTAPIASGYAANIGLGDPVQINANGQLVAISGDTDGAAIHGVFLGVIVKSSDRFDVRPFRKNWVSGTVTEGAAAAQAQFIPAKGNRFVCRPAAGQSVALTSLNDLLAATPGAPDTYGNSTLSIDAASTPANAAAATVRVVDFVRNEAGTAIAYVVELVNAA